MAATHTPPPQIAFVGIGAIGLPMALQIKKQGFEVTGVDPFPAQLEKAAQSGLTATAESQVAATADVVVVMVATPKQLFDAALGETGLCSIMKPGSTLIVMSTVGPAPVKEVAQHCAKNQIGMIDCPVTGGVARAKIGQLNLFASGDPQLIDSVSEVLAAMGKVIDCGTEIGMGQSFKAVNQLLCSVHLAAAGEALAFAQKMGLDPAKVLPAVESGAAGSWMLSDRGPRMLQGLDAEVTSAISIFVKDSSLVSEIADQIGFDAVLVKTARQRFLAAADAGLTSRDDSQVIQTYLG